MILAKKTPSLRSVKGHSPGDELASNKGWQEAILNVRHIESITPLSIECTFGV